MCSSPLPSTISLTAETAEISSATSASMSPPFCQVSRVTAAKIGPGPSSSRKVSSSFARFLIRLRSRIRLWS